MSDKPLALDLCSGFGGWAEGLEAEGWDVIRVDIVDMFTETGTLKPPNCLLMLQDIRTFHGSQAKRCSLIVASPPCTEYSWMAMPWSRAKQVARALRGENEFPANYRGSRTIERLNALFDACFRIQREASEAAGHHIPLIVENVKGAQPWVGRARWHYGSFYLWGDVPALMPSSLRRKVPGMNFHEHEKTGKPGRSFQSAAVEGVKQRGRGAAWFDKALDERCKEATEVKNGGDWFGPGSNCSLQRRSSSGSTSRKAASAQIAKIPYTLASHIARVYYPKDGD